MARSMSIYELRSKGGTMRFLSAFIALVVLAASLVVADDNLDESKAIEQLEQLGGRIRRQNGSNEKNQPVTGVTIPDR